MAPAQKSTTVSDVKSAMFTVNVGDLEDGPKELCGLLPREWMQRILHDTEVEPSGENDGSLEVTLTKNGPNVLVQGRLRVTVSLPCARTLDPAIYDLRPDVFLMLTPSSSGEAHFRSPHGGRLRNASRSKKSAKKGGWENDPELSDDDAAQDTYVGDQIVLDDFLREFILLEIPMLPLREDLRGVPFEANSPLPAASLAAQDGTVSDEEKPLDPRLSPLRDLKARLENKE